MKSRFKTEALQGGGVGLSALIGFGTARLRQGGAKANAAAIPCAGILLKTKNLD